MEKHDMREWVASLEEMIDNKLKKWRKENKIENGEAVHLRWQWEQTHMQIDVFWEDSKETLTLEYMSPRSSHSYMWHGLDDKTFNRVQDRIGNLAQNAMHPPIDPDFP